jgi:dolichyl-diphosphooligosaccharide--protein glycosyltransferase
MSWWDYSHWIIRISQRIPNSSAAGQVNAAEVARFFIAQDENSANEIVDKMRSQYMIIDHAMPTTKFYAMPRWAGSNEGEFFGTYYVQTEDGELEPVTLFYPTYYRSTVVRLYNFDGQAVEPEDATIVISYEEKLSQEGANYRGITSSILLASYEEAVTYISNQESGNYRVVGTDQFTSPVPLEEMTHYKLVYTSPQKWHGKPAVKIFEYVQ